MIKTTLVLFFTLLSVCLTAQTKIKGIIKDAKGEPLPGVNVMVKNSYDGTSSIADGTFSMVTEEKGKQILLASFVGYKASEQTVDLNCNEINLSINLKE